MKKWLLDLSHSEVTFKIKHLMITNLTGHFRDFHVEALIDEHDFSKIQDIKFTAEVNSIDTGNKDRDQHLKGPAFFNVTKYRQITFTGTKYEMTNNSGVLSGALTICGNTMPITLTVEFGGANPDIFGQIKAGFTVNGKISRKEFGLNWGSLTEAGHIVVGDEIVISCEIQLTTEI